MRSIWRGAISFGLIHIPIRLYPGSKPREFKFKMLHGKDLSEIRYARICKKDGKEVPWEDIVKGYEYEKGSYVVLTPKDFEDANPKKTQTIEILDFIKEVELDPIYYENPYFLEPEKGGQKAYNLLKEALKKSKKVAIVNFIFRQHQHLGVIKPYKEILILQQLRYESELLSPKDLKIAATPLNKKEIDFSIQLIDQLTKPFNPKNYVDSYEKEMKKIIKAKGKGKKIPVKTEKVTSPKVHDIMALLKQSLQETKKKTKKKSVA